jgi:predicted small secreted protein
MKHKFVVIILVLTSILLSGCTSASFSGNYVLEQGKTLRGNLFVTSGSVTMQENSRVTGTIMLTSGELRIGKNAQVGGDVVLTSGEVYMAEGSVIHGDLILSSSDIAVHQAQGATIEGNTTTDIAPFAIGLLTKGFLLYCVLPIVLLIAILLGLGTWLGRQSKKRAEVVPATATAGGADAKTKLENLKKMLDEGLISKDDYETKKADILSKM